MHRFSKNNPQGLWKSVWKMWITSWENRDFIHRWWITLWITVENMCINGKNLCKSAEKRWKA